MITRSPPFPPVSPPALPPAPVFFALPVDRSDFPCRNGFFGQGAYGFSTFFSGTDFLRRRGLNDLLGEAATAVHGVLFPASVRFVSRPVPPSPLRRVHHRRFDRLPPSFLPRKGKAGPGLPALLEGVDGDRHDPQVAPFPVRHRPPAARLVRVRADSLRPDSAVVPSLVRHPRDPVRRFLPPPPVSIARAPRDGPSPSSHRDRGRRPAGGDPRLFPFFQRVRNPPPPRKQASSPEADRVSPLLERSREISPVPRLLFRDDRRGDSPSGRPVAGGGGGDGCGVPWVRARCRRDPHVFRDPGPAGVRAVRLGQPL